MTPEPWKAWFLVAERSRSNQKATRNIKLCFKLNWVKNIWKNIKTRKFSVKENFYKPIIYMENFDMEEMENILKIEQILNNQNTLLDIILAEQVKIRQAVMEKNWMKLQECIETIREKTDVFVELEKDREVLASAVDAEKIAGFESVAKAESAVRGKLLKSKVENNALGNYVKIVKDFVQGVIDNVVPQRRNTLYSRKGNIIKPQPESMVLNRLF